MSHEIMIMSAYNGRLHSSTIFRAEDLIGIEVDGKVVYFDKTRAPRYGVTIENDPCYRSVVPLKRKHLVRKVPR